MEIHEVINLLKKHANPENVQGMERYGVKVDRALGLSVPQLKQIARQIGTNHALALQLWDSDIHDARHLAALVADPAKVSEQQMEDWVREFNSWDICDGCSNNLFRKTPFAHQKAVEWSSRTEEYVKRAGFVLMAVLAVHNKKADDGVFLEYLPIIQREATDERNFVKKAVNWALRQIGKRNRNLNTNAIRVSREIQKTKSKSARWIAADALRELTSNKIQQRLKK